MVTGLEEGAEQAKRISDFNLYPDASKLQNYLDFAKFSYGDFRAFIYSKF